MLKQLLRLNKDKDFATVFKSGRLFKGRFLSIRVKENLLGYNRFGVMVGLKISKKAVERNLLKRQIKDILQQENLKIKQSLDIIVVPFPLILANNYQDISTDIISCLTKLSLYEKHD